MMFAAMILAASTLATPAPIPNIPDEHQANVYRALGRLSMATICDRSHAESESTDGAAALLQQALEDASYPDPSRFTSEAKVRMAEATKDGAPLGLNVCESLSRTIAEALND